jgi:hypothetical protein
MTPERCLLACCIKIEDDCRRCESSVDSYLHHEAELICARLITYPAHDPQFRLIGPPIAAEEDKLN